MRTSKEWAEGIRKSMGNFIRADPVLTTGQSLIESIVSDIQVEALRFAKDHPELIGQAIEDRTFKVWDESDD